MRIFIVILSLMLNLGCKNTEDAIFVVPEGYTGYIIIIYNQENGAEMEYKEGKRVYEIPSTGILKTKFKANYGTSNFPLFYYGKVDGNEIPYKTEINSVSANNVNAFGGSVGKANKDLAGTSVVEFSLHYIGNEEQIREAIREVERMDIGSLGH